MLVPMRFSEHELTAALTGAAKIVLATQDKDVRRRRRGIDEVWDELDRVRRYELLRALGSQLLPVLVGLPDVEVAFGARATYTDVEISRVVEERLGEDGGRLRRAVLVKARVALVQAALASLPPRSDPDTLTVPDHL